MSDVYEDYFTSSVSIWMTFISSSCLIALARTSSIMLNRSAKSRYLFFILDLTGKPSLLPLNMMLAVIFFVDSLYHGEKVSFYFNF